LLGRIGIAEHDDYSDRGELGCDGVVAVSAFYGDTDPTGLLLAHVLCYELDDPADSFLRLIYVAELVAPRIDLPAPKGPGLLYAAGELDVREHGPANRLDDDARSLHGWVERAERRGRRQVELSADSHRVVSDSAVLVHATERYSCSTRREILEPADVGAGIAGFALGVEVGVGLSGIVCVRTVVPAAARATGSGSVAIAVHVVTGVSTVDGSVAVRVGTAWIREGLVDLAVVTQSVAVGIGLSRVRLSGVDDQVEIEILLDVEKSVAIGVDVICDRCVRQPQLVRAGAL